jgi:hypothetical protein
MLRSSPLGMLVQEESELGMEMVAVSEQVVMAEPAELEGLEPVACSTTGKETPHHPGDT